MKSVAVFGLCALMTATANAAVRSSENNTVESAAPTLSESRVSKYSGARGGELPAATGEQKSHGDGLKNKTGATKTYREKSNLLSSRSAYFDIYDAGITLRHDADGDSYHREFRLRFDADSYVGDALVYARLYIRRIGQTDWELYHVTDDFWIYGTSGTDDYYVTTTLDDGFATAEYDILIDLYESGYSGVVATLDPYDDESLGYVPLEEAGLDAPIEISGFNIDAVSTTLMVDDDNDGYYSTFRVTFDPDTNVGVQSAYAVIWVRPQGGEWVKEHESETFVVDPSGNADAYSLTAEWISGYPTSHYDIQIDLYDAATDLLAATAGSEWSAFSRVPLEDQSRDVAPNPPVSGGGGGDTSSRERGGGALEMWWVFALLGLAGVRRWRANLD